MTTNDALDSMPDQLARRRIEQLLQPTAALIEGHLQQGHALAADPCGRCIRCADCGYQLVPTSAFIVIIQRRLLDGTHVLFEGPIPRLPSDREPCEHHPSRAATPDASE